MCWYGGTIYGAYYGVTRIIDGTEYASEATKEQCLLIDYKSEECSFDCDCDEDNSCSTCYGTSYEYTATVQSKCADTELYSHDIDDSDCPASLKAMNSEYTCYVLDCEEEEFSFTHASSHLVVGVLCVDAAVWYFFCPCFYHFYCNR